MVEFRRKKAITTDTAVSQNLADTFDGGTTTALIQGGMTKNKYLFQADLASKPTFGDAELKSLDFDFYVNSISIGENTTKYPEITTFLLKGDTTITEGFQSRINDSDIIAFSSVADGFASMGDTFDGSGQAYGDSSTYRNIARTIFREDARYCMVSDAEEYGQKGYKWRHTKDKHTEDEIRTDFGVKASDIGIVDTEGTRPNYIKVSSEKKHSWKAGKMASIYKQYWRKCMPNEAHAGIGYEIWVPDSKCKSEKTDMSTTEGYGNEATPSNTIFDMVRGSAEFASYDTDANATKLFGVGMPRFNTENFLTAPHSLELFTFWTGDSTNKAKVTYDPKIYSRNSSVNTTGALNRQECVLVKKNIPYPNTKAAMPSKETDGVTRIVFADISANNFVSEGHGLSENDVVFVDDFDEDVWGSLVGTSAATSTSMETRNATAGHYVRNVAADTFQLSTTTNDSEIYALSGGDNTSLKIRIPDATNEVLGASEAVRAEAIFADYDYSPHAATIEMDVNIKKLAKAFSFISDEGEVYEGDGTTGVTQDQSQHYLTLRRGFHVVFGTEAPEPNDTLFDYIARMTGLHNASGSTPFRVEGPGWDDIQGTDDKDTLWAVRGSNNTMNTTSQNPCFGGFSVMNTEFGIQVIPFNGVQGTSTTSNNGGSYGLYIPDHDFQKDDGNASSASNDLFLRQDTEAGSAINDEGATGVNLQVGLEDIWSKFIISVDPTSSVPAITDFDGGRGNFSLGRLYVTTTDGEILKLGHASQKTGKNYLDLGLFGDGYDFYSYNTNKGKVSGGSFVTGEKYKITDRATTDWSGWGGPSSAADGDIFIATGAGSNTGNKATSLTQDPSNWPKHMSIWLTNYKSAYNDSYERDELLGDGVDAESKVLIDQIQFKDFNYEITNSSQLDGQKITSPIKIETGKSFKAPQGLYPTFDRNSTYDGTNTTTIDAYYSTTPTLLSIGLKNRDYLSVNSTTSTAGYFPWTEWPYGFWLNDFSANNLSKVGDIPDDHIKGTVSMSAYTDAPAIIPLGHQFKQKAIDYQEYNGLYNSGTLIQHNGYLAYEDYSYGGTSSFATGFLDTGFKVNTNDVSEKQFNLAQQAQFTGSTIPIPIRVGDKVRIVESNTYRGGSTARSYEYTVASVTGAMDASTGVDSSLTFTVSETPTLAGDGGESNADDWATGYAIYIQTPGLCRNFSQKGGFQFYNNSNDEHCAVKRENIAASARVIDIVESDAVSATIITDCTTPFDLEDDEEYVAYLYGEDVTFSDTNGLPDIIASNSANAKTGLKIISKDKDSNSITFDWDGKDNAGTAILTYDNIHKLYISPWRYWVQIMINLTDSSGQELSGRQYGNVQLMNNNWVDSSSNRRSWFGEGLHATSTNDFVDTAYSNRTGLGTTWNEWLFNDTTTGGVNGAYLNNWNLDKVPEHSTIECDTDFGFGEYDDGENSGGYTGKVIVEDSKYNRIRMPKVTSAANLEPTDTVKFLLDYNDVGLSHTTTLRTKNDTTYPPYLYTVFEDTKPDNPSLEVKPYEADPFLPEFVWKADGDDLWYGILHIDSESINSQYHNGIFHMPMNESGVHGATVSVAGDELFASNATNGSTSKTALFTYTGALVDAEGLAGNCVRFDGADDRITYTASSNEAFPELDTAVASGGSGAASIVVHVTPDHAWNGSSGIGGTTNVIFDGKPFYINYDADNGKIQARCYTSATAYVALEGPDIITDGQTPTCIIVTIDNSLKSGNCKLFINGAVVDQSGLISSSAPATDGTGRNWYNNSGTPAVPFVSSTAVTVGAASNSFMGRIEELVIYKSCIYPVVPSNGRFVLDKALKEINNETPISYNARLFIKDYHNIRGSTTDEVAASSSVSYRKAAFRLKD